MFDPFEGLPCSQTVRYLRGALEQGGITHAYLLAGPAGCGSDLVAARLAAALLAAGDQEQFQAALRGAHPDLHVLEPASSAGYLVEQVREVVRDSALAPVRAACKVYIVKQADSMRGAPANAFLKTLEEPPESVCIVMLAAAEGSVLPTIRSRCQVLSLAAPANACELAQGAAQQQGAAVMERALSACAAQEGNRSMLALAKELVQAANAGVEELKDSQAQAQREAADYLAAGARKELEQTHKRQVTMEQRAGYTQLLDAGESWLRDCLLIAGGAPQLACSTGAAAQGLLALGAQGEGFLDPAKQQLAQRAGCAGIAAAVTALGAARTRIARNVTPQLALEAMLFEIREALCPR
ncbi:MAG: hypothetical protein ACI36W_04345 [Coriobacteriales bacterium]